jgi:hypothetical protein
MSRPGRIAAAASLCLLVVSAFAQAQGPRLYKWVDEDGNVHYSDRVESSTPTSSTVERLSANGIRIGTPHSAQPANREQARELEQARRVAQRDTMLLTTYGSEMELLRAHDESRIQIEETVRAAEGNIQRLRRDLSERIRANSAQADRDALAEQLTGELERLETLRQRRFELHERQDQEVARYRELTTRNG